jgi:drug/metabolite transporter (DMT)-like permease
MQATVLPALALLLNALIFGVSWWPFRALQDQGLHPLWATAFTFILTTAGLSVVRPGAWKDLVRNHSLWWLLAASGLANVGFNWAVTTGDVVRVVLLFYLMPAWSLLLAWPLLGEKPRLGAVLRLGLALAGVLIVLKTAESAWPLPASLPDWLALLGGLCFALTNVLLRRLEQTANDARMLSMFVGSALMASAAAWAGQHLGLVTPMPWPSAHWLALAIGWGVALMVGNLALQYGAARLKASTTSLIMLTEVVFASTSSVLLGVAELTLQTTLGGSMILLASLLAAIEPAGDKSPA